MLLLIATSYPKLKPLHEKYPQVGRLVTPKYAGMIERSHAEIPWAADNNAFSGFDADDFQYMLDRLTALQPHNGLFICAPDVVGDAAATLDLFYEWYARVAVAGPVALVAQDGLTPALTPWPTLDALFIGGTTAFKLSDDARKLIGIAKDMGKWVHMGRVNSIKRAELAYSWGVDSIDGSSFSRFTDLTIHDFHEKFLAHTEPTGLPQREDPPKQRRPNGIRR